MTAVFDLFNLFVENVFGNLLFSIVALAGLLAIICLMARMSILMMSSIVILFLLTMMVGFFGSLFAMLVFAFTAIYFFMAIVPYIKGWAGG